MFFCKFEDETTLHRFWECIKRKPFWGIFIHFATIDFGYINIKIENELFINHLFLIFNIYVHYSMDTRILNLAVLKTKVIKVRKLFKQWTTPVKLNIRDLFKISQNTWFSCGSHVRRQTLKVQLHVCYLLLF